MVRRAKGFWHKELPSHAPEWLPRWDNPEADTGESRTYLVVDEPAALVWAANFGALEWHAWTSSVDQPHHPTYALIDLDPGETTSGTICWHSLGCTARRSSISASWPARRSPVGAASRSGSRSPRAGLRRNPGLGRAAVQNGRRRRSRADQLEVAGERAGGLARLDYTQNAINKTLVAPYSPRPAPGAPVSAPIEWDELDDPSLRPDGYTIRTMPQRIAGRGDLFRDVLSQTQQLPALQ